jgi:copper(I)-binding protein
MFTPLVRRDRRARAVWLAALLAFLTVPSSRPLQATEAPLAVEQARLRPAAAGATTAAYLRLRNREPRPVTIVAVSSPVAAAVEIHRMQHQGDVMRMEMVRELTVPAGGEITLAPQGLHLMVIGVKRDLSPGERVPLRFALGDGRRVDASAIVEAGEGSR